MLNPTATYFSDCTDMCKNTQVVIQNSSLLLCVVTLTTTTGTQVTYF